MSNDLFKLFAKESLTPAMLLKDYKIVDCNSAFIQMLNYDSKEQLIGLNPISLSPKRQSNDMTSSILGKKMIKECENSGNHRFEWVYKKKNDELIQIDVELNTIHIDSDKYVHATLRDITDKKNMQETVVTQESDLKQFYIALNESAIVSKTDAKGIITFVNKKFCDISGYTQKELLGKKHSILTHPEVKKEFFDDMWKILKNKKTFKAVIRNMAKDGSSFYVDTTIVPFFDLNGDIKEYLSIRYDVTKLYTSNETLQTKVDVALIKESEQQQLLFQQSKLAAMGEMISMIAHQWRQPLSAVSSMSIDLQIKLALEDDFSKEYLNQQLKEINTQIHYMSQTISDFRDFFKPDKSKELVEVDDIVNSTLSMLEVSFRNKGVEIERNFETIKPLATYRNELQQVILNILKNSMDAMVENKIKTPKIVIDVKYGDDKKCNIIIKDNGGGMKEDIIQKIFEPYFTTKSEKNGTGIGLYMSKIIIEEHLNGKLSLSNFEDGVECMIVL